MGKQIKKIRPLPVNKYEKICERCGNGGICRKTVFRCKYCGYINGTEFEVVITRGGLED